VAELEEEKSCLEASTAELQKTIDSSVEAVISLHRAFDLSIED
jgi:hypothetical protein